MKRKVGELNNIPIVEGDPNLLKSNELLHKGGGQLSKRNKEGGIEDLASNSSSLIYVGLKKPLLYGSDTPDIIYKMSDLNRGIKYTNGCYYYMDEDYGYEEYYDKEYILAFAIPVLPEVSNNILNFPSFSTLSQLKLTFVERWGYTEEDFDSNFYELTKEEFFYSISRNN